MPPNPIRAALARGETIVAMWMALGSPEIAEAAVHHGFPFVIVDNEHGLSDFAKAVELQRAAQAAGGDVILRVPAADPTLLKLAMDRGFQTIMAPMINTGAQAKAFADACRYPPIGTRGYAAGAIRASGYGAQKDYLTRSSEEVLLLAQIEHKDAVDNIEAIAATPGIDGLFLGPNDLAGSIGRLEQLDHPDVMALCERMEEATL
ncbi:MAG: aldolase/citrate lyase family protein, partial [Pseudomonadota bacterium]